MITYVKTTETNVNPLDGLGETIILIKSVVDGNGIKTNETYSFEDLTPDATILSTIQADLTKKGYAI